MKKLILSSALLAALCMPAFADRDGDKDKWGDRDGYDHHTLECLAQSQARGYRSLQ
jgi:hypothetical protein